MIEITIQHTEYKQGGKIFIALGLCFVICLLFFSLKVQAEAKVPEKFIYNVYWAGIRAGSASLELKDTPEGLTITSRAVSAEFISLFYKVEDLAQSILYPNGYPSLYVLKIQEGRHKRDKATFFNMRPDNETQHIIYNNKLDNETVEFNFERPAFDPLSGLYEIRKRQLEVGRSEFIDIFDSKKLWNVEVQVLRKERITTPVGEFNTIVIKPIMQSEGIFMKKGDIYIWLTDDEKKIPAMIKSKVKIGSFVAKLVDGNY
ncbi:MAG: DUF3108 domain-containing protein [Thermodesulfovibrionia bacterium]|nr:DUF3108 domain-containing protein [Thermodesulfovibrionia bacterium]